MSRVKLSTEEIKASNAARNDNSTNMRLAEEIAQKKKAASEASYEIPAGKKRIPGTPVETWASERVVAMNKLLSHSGIVKHYEPKLKFFLPIYPAGFKCEFCDETFQHLTADTLQYVSNPGEVVYRQHLIDAHGSECCDVVIGEVADAGSSVVTADQMPAKKRGRPKKQAEPVEEEVKEVAE